MAIPEHVKIKNGELPPRPGVYFMKDPAGVLLYIGKATSLRTRVSSYFSRPQDPRIAAMVERIGRIDWRETPTAVEALVLESKLIKKHQPPYNVMEKDDRSMVHLAFTREPYPRPVLIRGHELARTPKRQFLKVFGPFRSAASVQAALDALRKPFPWSVCRPGRNRPCFYRHLGLCPGVCTGEISPAEYRRIVRDLMRYFDGRRSAVVGELQKRMEEASAREDYESAARLRDRLFALDHIRDVAVLKKDDAALEQFIDVFGRIEGYDVSNIGGQDAVGSMVVFVDGRPRKRDYRKFSIDEIRGPNDVAMMKAMLRRRFARAAGTDAERWALPDLVLIDGGAGQLNAARSVFDEQGLDIPLVGIAKGFDRKQDELVYDRKDVELARLVRAFKPLLQQVRDEAHRFAVSYHKKRRAGRFIAKRVPRGGDAA